MPGLGERVMRGNIATIVLLGIASAPQSEDARRYATRALSRISRLQAQHQPCAMKQLQAYTPIISRFYFAEVPI